jgi:hypothetical protein
VEMEISFYIFLKRGLLCVQYGGTRYAFSV